MKKITLLIILFVFSTGYSQTLLQGFEAGGVNGGPFGGMPVPVIEAGTGTNTSQVLKIVTNPTQEPWQGINLFLSPSTNLTVNKTLTIDVLSDEEITFLVKVNGGGIEAAAPVTHDGDGTWQTLSFTFNTSLDGKAADPSGTYSGFVIHPYWEVNRTQFFTPTVVPKPARTFYVDNIREPAPAPPAPPITGDVYINDNSLVGDVFCSAVGQNIGTATGSTSLPYRSIADLFADRVISPGATIHLDTGTYSGRITFSDTEDGTAGNIITVKGAGTDLTTLTSPLSGESLLSTNGADYMTFEDMTIAGGNELNAVLVVANSTNCTFNNLNITTNNRGIAVTTGCDFTTITKNTINGDNAGAGDYGIWFTTGASSNHTVSNNMVSNFAQAFRSDINTITDCNIYYNSFYANQYGFVGFVTNWDIRNNIFHTTSNNSAHTAFWYGDANSPAILDYNLYYHPNAAQAVTRWNLTVYATLADFVAATAYEDNGVEGNPLFTSTTDLHLQAGSPAIGAGTDVGVTEDIDGDARPLSGTFDIGADEYTVIISSDATLSALEVSEGTLVPSFSPAITEYTVVASSALSIPQITTATPTSLAASVVITQAPSVFEDATIVVTAEDGTTTETYTVRIGLVTSDIIQDFEPPATYTALTGDNGTAATIESSPAGMIGNSLQLVSTSGGATFQAGFFDQVSDFVVLTPENNTVQVDVYSTQAFNLRLKLEIGAGPIERTVQYTTPNTWQTLTFNFGAVTATYSRIVFFLNSNATNDGFLASQDFTAFVDNIRLSSVQTDRLAYTYQTGVWTPESPVGISTALDNILVIDGNPGIDGLIEVNDVEVASAASLDISSTGVLKLSGDIINNGNITFKSDANGSAQLDIFNGLITGSGDVTVERYIPAKRAYRLLTTSLNNAGSINANWQEGAVTTALGNGNPNPGFGTHITGGTAANGFDQNGSGAVSMFTFDNTFLADQPGEAQIDAWSAVDNTLNTNLSAGVPYLTFVRGDRTTDLNNSSDPATETTLRATGEIHTGPLTFDLSQVPEFYSLVGNPYQSVVDFDQVTRNDLTNFIYVWDTSIGTRGAYVSVELPLGNNEILPPVAGTSDASQFIPPGASFFVENLASGPITPSLTFNENNKVTGANQVTIFNTYPHFYINSRLYSTSDLQSGNTERDAIGLRFLDDYTTLGSDEDATKLGNPDENYAIINNGLRSIDKQAMPNIGHQIDLSINGYTETQYSLIFNIQNQPGGLGVFLNDAYLNTQVELTSASVYDFSIDETISESIAADRFSLSFDNTTLSVEDNVFGSDFNLFPNPTQDGRFSIKTNGLNTDDVIVTMHNMLGQQVYAERLTPENDGIINVNASRLSAGIYVLELSQNGQSFTQKVIVE